MRDQAFLKPMKHLFRRLCRIVSGLLASCMLLAVPAVSAAENDDTEIEAEVSLGLFSMDDSTFRISLHGLSGLLDSLAELYDLDAYGVFRYELVLDDAVPVRITGKIDRRGSKQWYDWRVQSTYLCREKKTASAVESYVSNEDTANWVVTEEKYDRKYYRPDTLESVSFRISHQDRKNDALVYTFPMDQVRTDAVLETPQFHADGMLTVRVPDPKTFIARIDIPKMRKDFSCFSTEGKNKVFRFLIRAVVSSYEWVQITVDGENASSPAEILFQAGEFHLNADQSNQFSYADKTIPVSDASFSFEEDCMIIRCRLPDDCPHDFRQMRYFALATNGRDIYSKYYIKPY